MIWGWEFWCSVTHVDWVPALSSALIWAPWRSLGRPSWLRALEETQLKKKITTLPPDDGGEELLRWRTINCLINIHTQQEAHTTWIIRSYMMTSRRFEVWGHVTSNGQSVSMSWRRAHLGTCDQILILSEFRCVVFVVRPQVKVKVTLQLTVSQSLCQGIEPILGLVTRYYFLSEGCFLKFSVLSFWGALSDERSGLSFVFLYRSRRLSYFTTDSQSVNMSWYRVPFWDLRPDIISCRHVAVWNLRSCIYWAPSLTRGRVCNLQCNHLVVSSLCNFEEDQQLGTGCDIWCIVRRNCWAVNTTLPGYQIS
jgi:hypothetical protein